MRVHLFMDTEFKERLTHGGRNNRGSEICPTRHRTLQYRSHRNSVCPFRPLSTPSMCNTRVSISVESASTCSAIRRVHCVAAKQQKSAKHKRVKNSPVFSGPFSKKMVEGRLTIRFDKKERHFTVNIDGDRFGATNAIHKNGSMNRQQCAR